MSLMVIRFAETEPSMLGSVYSAWSLSVTEDQPCSRPNQPLSAAIGTWPGREETPRKFSEVFAKSIPAARRVAGRA